MPIDTTLDPDHNNAASWDARYVADDIPWDKQAACPGLVDFLAAHPPHGRWLVPGCGLGHDVAALQAAGADALGIDLSEAAASRARALGREVVVADLFALPEDWAGTFDGVWEHTCFCAIHPEQRDQYVAAVRRALKADGQFLGIFFEVEEDIPKGPPFKTTFATLRAHFERAFEIERHWVPQRQVREAAERMILARPSLAK